MPVEDFNRLKKTSVDFTLCTTEDKPFLCIEFDGVHQGTNVGDRYVAPFGSDPWRRQITELKLRIAHASAFPYFVMASSQFEVMDADDKLAIVDCVIGSVLADGYMEERFKQGFDPAEVGMSDEEFEKLPYAEQEEIVEDWAIGIEVESKFKKNPLFEITYALREKLGVRKMGWKYLDTPLMAKTADPFERAKLFNTSPLIGCQAYVELPSGSRMTGTVWVPNFQTPSCSTYGFLDKLATYAALKRAERKVERARKRDNG